MPIIRLVTHIKASPERVFNLSRDIDLHEKSTQATNEKAIAGKTSGLLELNDSVTWRAKHLGVYQRLTVLITSCESPNYFVDEMTKGAFKRFRHEHFFHATNEGTEMIDVFDYTTPFGFLGKWIDRLFLEKYMTRFLQTRNQIIKETAEMDENKKSLPSV